MAVNTRYSMPAAGLVLLSSIFFGGYVRAQMWDDSGGDPWDRCAECHGLDGAGNHIKFPRLAGQKPYYIIKQLNDFRSGRRTNDGGQMQKTAAEIKEEDYPRVAQWFASQTPPWPKLTLDIDPDLSRAGKLWRTGINGLDACRTCHSAAALDMFGDAVMGPRIAGQRDFYIVKQLKDYRAGRRRDNDPDDIMTKIANRLNDADITSLAVFLSQNPALDDEDDP